MATITPTVRAITGVPSTSNTERACVPFFSVSSPIAPTSIITIGTRIVPTAGQNAGRPAARSGRRLLRRPIWARRSDASSHRRPRRRRVGRRPPPVRDVDVAHDERPEQRAGDDDGRASAMMSPNARVRPRSACRAVIAATGPGCGGTRPCSTDSPASAGMPIRSTGVPARRETSSTTGTSRTTPISKNSGKPIRAANPAIAQGSRCSDTLSVIVSTILAAPPDSVSRPPIMAPRATSRPTEPVVAPTPVVKLPVSVPARPSPRSRPSSSRRGSAPGTDAPWPR